MAEPIRLGVRTEDEMLADGERLVPAIARCAAYLMAVFNHYDDDPVYQWELVRGYLHLMPCEREFVREAAFDIFDAEDGCVEECAKHWLSVCREDAA